MFSELELAQINSKGIDIASIEHHIELFKKGIKYANLVKPAGLNDGIVYIPQNKLKKYIDIFEENLAVKEIVKFVPASGAASRMFKELNTLANSNDPEAILAKEQGVNSAYNFFKNIKGFAFYETLKAMLLENGLSLDKLVIQKQYKLILEYLLTNKGLNYKNSPKALIQFHKYGEVARTAIEEQLFEGANYARAEDGTVKIHFTIQESHLDLIRDFVDDVLDYYEDVLNVTYDISYSVQNPATETIAVDFDNHPVRNADGSLLFRPAGHGALIPNLNEIEADLIFIKNIDNITTERNSFDTTLYKKVLAGVLIAKQRKIFKYVDQLNQGKTNEELFTEIETFLRNDLAIIPSEKYASYTTAQKVKYFIAKLDRPLRVCGMVKADGDVGGGPFWVKNKDNTISLHIIESVQLDTKNPEQVELFNKGSHFNPVDLVVSFQDYEGNLYDITDFVDPEGWFITEKSENGKSLKALEMPGLWNGGMSNWNTIFIEVPASTFNPVKSINDLLLPEHQ